MEILSHINKRVKPNKNIKLPLDALINQFTDDKVPMFVKNFTIIYLEMSIERLSLEEIAVHIPNLIRGISRRPTPQRTTIFHMILPVAIFIDISSMDQDTYILDIYIGPAKMEDGARGAERSEKFSFPV